MVNVIDFRIALLFISGSGENKSTWYPVVFVASNENNPVLCDDMIWNLEGNMGI